MTSDTPRLRLGVIGIIAVSLFAALFARLWFLQVMTSPDYVASAQAVATRTVTEQAPRGRILDRNANVIVGNRRSIVVSVDFQAYSKLGGADQQRLRNRLADELTRDQPGRPPVTADFIVKRLADPRYSHFKPVPIATDMTSTLWVYLAEHTAEFPTVSVDREEVRDYRYGSILAHVLGYVGAINGQELHQYQNKDQPYANDDQVGKAGVEKSFEKLLHGVPGKTVYEVDARNKPIKEISHTDPVPGYDVYLTIDVNIQATAEKALATELFRARETPNRFGYPPSPAGSTVVEDPSNGQILALASYPTYDPRAFVGGISKQTYDELTDPDKFQPFTDRATEGLYAPGSTFKLITSIAGLRTGVITPDFNWNDTGSYTIQGCTGGTGCTFQNSGGAGLGPVTLPSAITLSSDTYYYRIGDELWRNTSADGLTPIQDVAGEFGLGKRTGIELTDYSGNIPTPAGRKLLHEQNPKAFPYGDWFSGDNAQLSIGQTEVLVSPLQLTNAYATFANGGTLWQPTLLLKVNDAFSPKTVALNAPKAKGKVDLPPNFRDPMMAGFDGVPKTGTAAATFQGFPFDKFNVLGKTGTAQIGVDPKTGVDRQDTSLFVGFGGTPTQQYVASSVMEQSGFGAEVAAPVVRDIFLALANGQLVVAPEGGFPLDPNGRPVFDETLAPGAGQTPPPPTNGEAAVAGG